MSLKQLVWQRLYPVVGKRLDWLMSLSAKRDLHDDTDFLADANYYIDHHAPRGAHVIVWTSAAALLFLLLWAAFSPIDEVTKGEGKVVPSRDVQVLQSLDGGMVSEILVREGQAVKAGELLLKIDPTRFASSLGENRAQYLSLTAKAARLRALADGKPFTPPADVQQEAPDLIDQERVLYESKMAELDATVGVARQQLSQRSQELNEIRARRDQAQQSYELTAKELEVTRPLAKTGAVSDVELLRLERDVARFRGERDSSAAQLPRIQAAIAEASRKIQEVELTFRNQARSELSETTGKLGQLTAGSVALKDRVKQSDIRSPVNGTVKQILFNTVGGVVQPGKEVIEIVPTDDALLLEAKVQPRDIAFLHPGQKALVKFTAYDFAIYGGLDATVETIGADTVTDDKGNAFYLIKVRTHSTRFGAQKLPIIPGMVAEVDIITGKRSILTYLMKPVIRAKANALRER
ncbi:adhesin transport system membrane fusion protein [Chitinivorax tropicus]|uniref:Membrane fusion protein (MFP) family protein n=1 Tax=Chitinivorax tropicus TaxID=714531 RepID=A0A840MIK1_9PROT|nr:HlyD family type I secretion periplasmic adaptor subunit [Chitinivorax tropicus]MBB5018230.1 adhesin transport system membrane fusion protein [Chitinivorax tropicus]